MPANAPTRRQLHHAKGHDRVRYARHQFLSDTLSDQYYDSRANMRMKVKL
jgi:hypothetical protein